MGRKLRRDDISNDLEWLLGQSLVVADRLKLSLTAAYIATAMDQFHNESARALSASKPIAPATTAPEQPHCGPNSSGLTPQS